MAHRLAPGAEIELDDIWFWTAKESGSIDIADRLVDSITERFFLLARHPHVGRRRDDDLRPGLRSFPVGRHTIIYHVEGDDVLILHSSPPTAISSRCYSSWCRRAESQIARCACARRRHNNSNSPVLRTPLRPAIA